MNDLDPTEFFKQQGKSVFSDNTSVGVVEIEHATGIVGFLINHSGNLVRTKKRANIILLSLALLFVLLTFFVSFSPDKRRSDIELDPITGQEIIPGQVPGGI